MIVSYSVYRPSDGFIYCTGTCEEKSLPHVLDGWPAGSAILEQRSDDAVQYVVNGELVDRPQFPVAREASVPADGETTFTLAELPEGTEVQIDDGAPIVLPDTTLELTFDAPGTYTLYLRRFPYIDAQVTIHAY